MSGESGFDGWLGSGGEEAVDESALVDIRREGTPRCLQENYPRVTLTLVY